MKKLIVLFVMIFILMIISIGANADASFDEWLNNHGYSSSDVVILPADVLYEYGSAYEGKTVVTSIKVEDKSIDLLKANTKNNDTFSFSIVAEFKDRSEISSVQEGNEVVIIGMVGKFNAISLFGSNKTVSLENSHLVDSGLSSTDVENSRSSAAQDAKKAKNDKETDDRIAAENEIQRYKDLCESVDYSDVERNPKQYKGKFIRISGTVIQVSEGWFNTVTLRVKQRDGNIWYVTYSRKDDNESRIIENDRLTFYGKCTGVETYTTVIGGRVTIPSIDAEYWDAGNANVKESSNVNNENQSTKQDINQKSGNNDTYVKDLEITIDELKKVNGNLSDTNKDLESQITDRESQITDLESQIIDRESQIRDLKAQIDELKEKNEEIDNLKNKYTSLMMEKEELSRVNEQLNMDISNADKKKDEYWKENKKLQDEIAELSRENETLTKKLDYESMPRYELVELGNKIAGLLKNNGYVFGKLEDILSGENIDNSDENTESSIAARSEGPVCSGDGWEVYGSYIMDKDNKHYYIFTSKNTADMAMKMKAEVMFYDDEDRLIGVWQEEKNACDVNETVAWVAESDVPFSYAVPKINETKKKNNSGQKYLEYESVVSGEKVIIQFENKGTHYLVRPNYCILLFDGNNNLVDFGCGDLGGMFDAGETSVIEYKSPVEFSSIEIYVYSHDAQIF